MFDKPTISFADLYTKLHDYLDTTSIVMELFFAADSL